MSFPSAWALQAGLFSFIQALPDLAPLLGSPVRIYDAVPPNTDFPFITIGEARMREYEGVSGAGEHEVRVQIYSRWGGRKELKTIIDILGDRLVDTALLVEGHRVIQSRLLFADIFRQVDSDSYQATMRFRFLTEPTSIN